MTFTAAFVNDPFDNTGYTYTWQVQDNPITGLSLVLVDGGGSGDNYATYAAPEASGEHPSHYSITCTIWGADAGNSVTKTVSTEVRPRLLGDLDEDGDVDLHDFERFVPAMSGPDVATSSPIADLDGDADCDLADFAVFAANVAIP